MVPSLRTLDAWLASRPWFAGSRATGITQFSGGASNITCRVDVAGWSAPALVIRVQRDRGIFEPYDVIREARVQRALEGSAVPVPHVLDEEPAGTVLGAPFIVMEWVDAPHLGEAGPEADFGAFIRMVARIHAVDWRARGLEFLGVPETPRASTLAEVEAVSHRMRAFDCGGDALLSRAEAILAARAPDDGMLSFCQGDINAFNYLFRNREVVAVVDWEQARIGDLRSDIGQLVALSHLRGAPFGPVAAMPFVRAYEASAGRRLAGLEYFRALWLFQLGVIHSGWVAFNGSEPWYTRAALDPLLEAALAEFA